MAVNTDDSSEVTIVGSPHKDVLSISEQLRSILVEHCSKYLESKRKKGTNTEKPFDTTSYVTPVTQKDNLPSDGTPSKWSEGTICITGDSILNGIDEVLLSQKRLVKVRQFPGETVSDMYDHLKPILKRKLEFLIWHIGTNGSSKFTPN